MEKQTLHDEDGSFEVTAVTLQRPSRAVLFAVGAGGNPERHLPLFLAFAERGFCVVAPHFERLASPNPTDEALLLRARRLKTALDAVAPPDLTTVGVGHSIGAATLLALAGAKLWTRPGQPLPIVPDDRIKRLALMAPATGFFQAPGALDSVQVPTMAWVGTNDSITPVSQAQFLREALSARVPVEVRTVEGAGHFSFMHVLPPHVSGSLPERDTFLTKLATEIAEFAAA